MTKFRGLLVLAPVIACMVAVAPSTTFAQATPLAFDVPAGDLQAAVDAFSRQSGEQLIYQSEDLKGQRSPGFKGVLDAVSALERTLSGTGLLVKKSASGALVIVRAKSERQSTASPAGRGDAPQTVTVEGYRHDYADYTVTNRTGGSLMDLPGSVSVVTKETIADQQASTLAQVLRNTTDVVAFSDPSTYGSAFNMRGYQSSQPLADGLSGAGFNADEAATYGIELVEVLKGPSAILAGSSPPGGLINVIRKKPLGEDLYEGKVTVGTGNDMTTSFDAGGPLAGNGRLRYRMVASAQNGDGIDGTYGRHHDIYLAPSVGWKDPATDLVVGYEFSRSLAPAMARYTIADVAGTAPAPLERMPNLTAQAALNETSHRIFYSLDKELGARVTLVSKAQYEQKSIRQTGANAIGSAFDAASSSACIVAPLGDCATFVINDSTVMARNVSLDNFVRARFDLGPTANTVVAGFNYIRRRVSDNVFNADTFAWFPDDGQTVTSEGVQGSLASLDLPASMGGDPIFVTHSDVIQKGFYLQEQMKVAGAVLLASARSNAFRYVSNGNELAVMDNFLIPDNTSHSMTYNFGALYDLTPAVALYASSNQGFQPNNFADKDGRVIAPRRSRQLEIGSKIKLMDGRAYLTVSAFQIETNNETILAGFNFVPRFRAYYTAVSGEKNRGVEVELNGHVTRQWSVIAGYTWRGGVLSADDRSNDYTVLQNNPRHMFNLWTRYDVPTPVFGGRMWLAGGLFGNSPSFGDQTATLRLPGGTQTDASVGLRRDAWDLTLGVKNVFDRRLYSSEGFATYIPIADGRTVTASASYQF